MYKLFIKSLLDRLAAFVALIFLSPLFFIVWIFLLFANNGKPFFFQRRPGKNEKIFKIIKFKTMNDKKDEAGNLLPDKFRLTKTGAFIRKTSLDEIPQLLNVLKGDMSLIGPRPLLTEYLEYYTERETKRHSINPGITGWAQVNGRNTVRWDDRLEMDVQYVENLTWKKDMEILMKTIKNIISRKDIVVIPSEKYTKLSIYRSKNEVKS